MTHPPELSDGPIAAAAPSTVRVEQDGREVLLVELGAARERVSWLLAQNQRLTQEATETMALAQAQAERADRADGRAVGWRLLGIVLLGLYAIQALARLLPPL